MIPKPISPWIFFGPVALLYAATLYLDPTPALFSRFHKDDAAYFVTMGYNFAHHGVYSTDTFSEDGLSLHGTWPPAWPLTVASIIKFFGFNLLAITIATFALSLVNLFLLQRLFRKHAKTYYQDLGRGHLIADCAMVITSLSPLYYIFTRTPMTEVLFLTLTTSALLLMSREMTRRNTIYAGITSALAFLTRGYAITLGCVQIAKTILPGDGTITSRSRLALLFFLFFAPAVFSWGLFSNHIKKQDGIDHVTATFGTASLLLADANIKTRLQELYWHSLPALGEHAFPFLVNSDNRANYSDFLAITALAFLAVTGIGILHAVSRKDYTLSIWLMGNIAFILLFRLTQGRYWLSVLPFMFYFFFIGVNRISGYLLKTDAKTPIFSLCLTILFTPVFFKTVSSKEDHYYAPHFEELTEAMNSLTSNLPSNAVMIYESPHKCFALTQKRSLTYEEASAALNEGELENQELFVVTPFSKQSDRKNESPESLLGQTTPLPKAIVYKGEHLFIWHLTASSQSRTNFRGQSTSIHQYTETIFSGPNDRMCFIKNQF